MKVRNRFEICLKNHVSYIIWYLPVFLLTANPIVSIFNSEQNMQLQEIATAGLKLYFTAIPFVGFNIINICIFCINRKSPACTNHFLVKRIFNDNPYGIYLSFILKMTGVWLSFPVTECLVTLAGIALYIKLERGKKNV